MRLVNEKARFNYELGERVEAGLALSGAETKAAKMGKIDLSAARVAVREGEMWVVGMQIMGVEDPQRSRKLLLHKEEIASLLVKMKQGRRLLIPTAIYTKGPRVKLEVALARGKKKYEKREAIKKRDLEREVV